MTKIITRKMTTGTVRTAKNLARTIRQVTEKEGQRNPATKIPAETVVAHLMCMDTCVCHLQSIMLRI